MEAVIVFLAIVLVIGGFVALIIWKALKAPLPPPTLPSDLPAADPTTGFKLPEPGPDPQPVFQSSAHKGARVGSPAVRVENSTGTAPNQVQSDGAGVSAGRVAATSAAVVAVAAMPAVVAIPAAAVALVGAISSGKERKRRGWAAQDQRLSEEHVAQGGRGKEAPLLQVNVFASGKIEVDGRPATMAQLEQRLADLKSRSGTVRYYCESSAQDPPEAAQVLGQILNLGIPLTYAAKAQSADTPNPNGPSEKAAG